jgi:hypothetical protein
VKTSAATLLCASRRELDASNWPTNQTHHAVFSQLEDLFRWIRPATTVTSISTLFSEETFQVFAGNGQPIPAATALSRYSWTVPSPIPQLRAIWRCPNPNSNRNRKTSFVFHMDFLLAGTLSSFIYGVSMPGDCPASLHILLFVCGKHSAPSRTPFRRTARTVRLPTGIGVHPQTGMLFGITTKWCSASDRNPVNLRPDSPRCTRGRVVDQWAYEQGLQWHTIQSG